MSVYKDAAKNTWYVKTRYKTWDGETKWCTKRGFALKREALDWEREFLLSKSNSLDMSFSDFVKVYKEDRDTSNQTVLNAIRIYLNRVFDALNQENPGVMQFYQI